MFKISPHTERIGHITVAGGKNKRYEKYPNLEFCFRMSSDQEEFVEDEMDNVVYRTTFPHLFIKRPGTRYCNRVKLKREAYYIIYPSEAYDYFVASGLMPENPNCKFECTPEITALFEELKKCQKSVHSPGVPDRIDMICLRLISEVLMQNISAQNTNVHHEAVGNIASYIDNNLSSEIDLRKLAEQNGMSLRSFFRYWKEVFAETPARYIIRRRMELAASMLQRCNWDISQVAEKTGFSSTGYFIQSFKQNFGETPAAYRKKYRG